MLQSQSASSCYNPSSLVCEFNLGWMLSPVACLPIFHITHFSLQGKQIAKVEFLASDSGCCWQWVEVKRIQPYYQPTALEAFLSPKRQIKKVRDRVYLWHLFMRHSVLEFLLILPWANKVLIVHSEWKSKLVTLSLGKHRNDIKERITTEAQNSAKLPKPRPFRRQQ